MKKKNQMIMWIIVAAIMLAFVGFLICNILIAKTHEVKNPVATFEIENYGNIKIELYPEYAPNTVLNFINLINKGFYNGKTFYGKDINAIFAAKTQEGTVANPTISLVDSSVEAASEQDVNYQINGEFIANDFDANSLKHEKGVVSMLREEYSAYLGLTEQGYNSASSQFQIMLDTNRSLNGFYTGFGKVIEGLDIVEKIFEIEAAPIEEEETVDTTNTIIELATPAVIKNATVETYGVEYGMPEVHEAFDYNAFLQNYLSTMSN